MIPMGYKWNEDEGDDEEEPFCGNCSGTGLPSTGPIDQGHCHVCKGRGYPLPVSDDYPED